MLSEKRFPNSIQSQRVKGMYLKRGFAEFMKSKMKSVSVWWDSSCPLCRREISLMKRLDTRKSIDFIDIIGDDGSNCPLDRKTMLARFHAKENGVMFSGAAAFAAMWRAIPSLAWIGRAALRYPLLLKGLEFGYIWFLKGPRPIAQKWLIKWEKRRQI